MVVSYLLFISDSINGFWRVRMEKLSKKLKFVSCTTSKSFALKDFRWISLTPEICCKKPLHVEGFHKIPAKKTVFPS